MAKKEYKTWYEEKCQKKERKSSDDTFTPPEIYDIVVNWVIKHYGDVIEGKRIARPFYPGGDYQNFDYTDAVVIDNPPFSKLQEIVTFYTERDIPYFIFCNGNTAFNLYMNDIPENHVIIPQSAKVKYDNGVTVLTFFYSNFTEHRLIYANDLRLNQNGMMLRNLPKDVYRAMDLYNELRKKDASFYLDDFEIIRKVNGQEIWGGGIHAKEDFHKYV